MFKLEAFSAREGDALLLHYGSSRGPQYALIDAGPKGVFAKVVAPRLAALAGDESLRLRWTAVSHVDADHITGICDLYEKLKQPASGLEVDSLFHNAPGGPAHSVVPATNPPGVAPARAELEREWRAVLHQVDAITKTASYQQGADVANLAQVVGVDRNPPVGMRLLTGDRLPATIVAPLKVSVVAPSATHYENLIKAWKKKLGAGGGILRASIDTSITNLSSLVLLVEAGKRSMLLTGDARGDHIMDGLAELGVLNRAGEFTVDLLKVPHHGSDRSAGNESDLFQVVEKVRARHYVISANGRYDNPSPSLLTRLVKAQAKRRCTIWLTTPQGESGRYASAYKNALATMRRAITRYDASKIDVEIPAGDEGSVLATLEP